MVGSAAFADLVHTEQRGHPPAVLFVVGPEKGQPILAGAEAQVLGRRGDVRRVVGAAVQLPILPHSPQQPHRSAPSRRLALDDLLDGTTDVGVRFRIESLSEQTDRLLPG